MAKSATGRAARPGTASKTTAVTAPTAPRRRKAAAPGGGPARAAVRPTSRCKFTLFNRLGQPRSYYLVEPMDLPRPPHDPKKKTVAHSVIVVDRSGAMYGAIEETRDTLLKVLTLDEYAQF